MFFIYNYLIAVNTMDSIGNIASTGYNLIKSASQNLSSKVSSLLNNKKQLELNAAALLSAKSMRDNQILSRDRYEKLQDILNDKQIKYEHKDFIARSIINLSNQKDKTIISQKSPIKQKRENDNFIQSLISLLENTNKKIEPVIQYIYPDSDVQTSNKKSDISKLKTEIAEYKKENAQLKETCEEYNNRYNLLKNQKNNILYVENPVQSEQIQNQEQYIEELRQKQLQGRERNIKHGQEIENLLSEIEQDKDLTAQEVESIRNQLEISKAEITRQQTEIDETYKIVENMKKELKQQKHEQLEQEMMAKQILPDQNALRTALKMLKLKVMRFEYQDTYQVDSHGNKVLDENDKPQIVSKKDPCVIDYFINQSEANTISLSLIAKYLEIASKEVKTKLEIQMENSDQFKGIYKTLCKKDAQEISKTLTSQSQFQTLLQELMDYIVRELDIILDKDGIIKNKLKSDLTQLISDYIFYKSESENARKTNKTEIQQAVKVKCLTRIKFKFYDFMIKSFMRVNNIILSTKDDKSDTMSVNSFSSTFSSNTTSYNKQMTPDIFKSLTKLYEFSDQIMSS